MKVWRVSFLRHQYIKYINFIIKVIDNRSILSSGLLIIKMFFSIYLMVSLLTFTPSDPSWLQTSSNLPVNNIGGTIGAWFADTIFFIFGLIGYTIPSGIFLFCLYSYYQYNIKSYPNYFLKSLKIIGIFFLILTSCGLVSLIFREPIYFSSGGIIGSMVIHILTLLNINEDSNTISIVYLWGIWFLGMILLTGQSLLSFIKTICIILKRS
ncbi:DNA translocase FtsK 4TM domain-containing protein [Candidatus Profftia sp. (ex Adelges kitamiensis)]|uniref:DNA translocase FtsK 4TM domain-containing protein n=1 Tax=Candidatus Profftia sp. (ex Adelges kitamiensis) TaxID=2864218 RepID=UPI001CE296EC|nr:DNA translocase FtsK 4TM domain-containing protein [Candidatus Profftia sp. (ex Adelges kitamiensis)]